MWSVFKPLLKRFKGPNFLLGEILHSAGRETGSVGSYSYMEWRVKESVDKSRIFVAAQMIPDGYAGRKGSPTNYINFDIETAIHLRDRLTECIEFAKDVRHKQDENLGG